MQPTSPQSVVSTANTQSIDKSQQVGAIHLSVPVLEIKEFRAKFGNQIERGFRFPWSFGIYRLFHSMASQFDGEQDMSATCIQCKQHFNMSAYDISASQIEFISAQLSGGLTYQPGVGYRCYACSPRLGEKLAVFARTNICRTNEMSGLAAFDLLAGQVFTILAVQGINLQEDPEGKHPVNYLVISDANIYHQFPVTFVCERYFKIVN